MPQFSRWKIDRNSEKIQHQKSYLELRYVLNITTIIVIILIIIAKNVREVRGTLKSGVYVLHTFSTSSLHSHIVTVRQIYASINYNYQQCLRFMGWCYEKKQSIYYLLSWQWYYNSLDHWFKCHWIERLIHIHFKANCSARWWNLWQVTFVVYRPRLYVFLLS